MNTTNKNKTMKNDALYMGNEHGKNKEEAL